MAILASTLAPQRISGQSGRSPALAPRCPAGQRPVRAEEEHVIGVRAATAWNRHVYTAEERERVGRHAEALRRHFVAPKTLGDVPILAEAWIPVYGGAPTLHSAVGGRLVLITAPSGALRTTFWQLPPFSESFATSVVRAAEAAGKAGAFRDIPRVEGSTFNDTLVVQVRSIADAVGPDEFALMRARLPRYEMTAPPREVEKGRFVRPTNVMYAPGENYGEMVVLVGSGGQVVHAGSHVSRVERPGFSETMRRYIETASYVPARSGKCSVPALYLHAFDFATDL